MPLDIELKKRYNKVWHRKWCRTLRGRYSNLVRCGPTRKHTVAISFEQYIELVKQPCYYCGGPLAPAGHGLDRIDATKEYTIDNVRPCCKLCNQAKNDMTENEFAEWVATVYNNFAIALS